MSTIFSTGLNRKIDALMDRLFGAGVASHATIIEQINYLMFLRALAKHDDEAKLLNPNHEEIFKGDLAKYKWDNLLMLNAEVLFDTLEEAYRKLPELTTDKIITLLFRNAHIKIYDKPTLRVLLHEIEKLVTELDDVARHGEKDIFGDMYEYLLSKLAQAGTNGQFRTPRHIIKFIVDVVDPSKGETILDPACGTAGFLVEALDHLRHKYTSERFVKDGAYPMDKLTGDERNFIFNHTFTGFDSDEDMVKFGVMNLYLHNLSNAQIKRQNTLVDTAGDRTKWDVILANPPFAGKIEAESVSEDLRMGTRATEVLFVRYMIDHLSSQGKAGIIVPEGIIFQSTNAHKQLRQKLIDAGLWCVVSLPAGVFQPYSGVKTSILFIDEEIAKKFNRIMFITVNSDGFDLSANRRPVLDNDIPNALRLIGYCKDEINAGNIRYDYYFPFEDADHSISIAPLNYSFEKVNRINDDANLSLQANKYRENTIIENRKWDMVKISELVSVISAKTKIKSSDFLEKGAIPIIDQSKQYISGYTNNEDALIKNHECIAFGDHTRAVKYIDFDFAQGADGIKILQPNSQVLVKYLFYVMANINIPSKGYSRHWAEVKDIEIPVPPKDIQQDIINELNIYQKIIDSAKIITDTYRPVIRISDNANFIKLGEVVINVKDVADPTKQKGDVEYIGLENIVSNEGRITGDTKSNYSKIKSLKNHFKKDDILYGKLRPNLNKVWLADRDGIASTDILILRVSPNCSPIYYANYMLGEDFNKEVLRGIKGAQLPRVSFDYMSSIMVPKPNIDEQKNVAKELEKELSIIESNRYLMNIYRQKIQSKIEELWA